MKLREIKKFEKILRKTIPLNMWNSLNVLIRERAYRFEGSILDFFIESLKKNLIFYGIQVDNMLTESENDLLPLDEQEPYPAELVWLGGHVFLIEFDYECSADGFVGKEDVKTVLKEYQKRLKENGYCSSIGIKTSFPKRKYDSLKPSIVHSRFIIYHINPTRMKDFIPLATEIKEEFGVEKISIRTTYLCGATDKKDVFTWKTKIYV